MRKFEWGPRSLSIRFIPLLNLERSITVARSRSIPRTEKHRRSMIDRSLSPYVDSIVPTCDYKGSCVLCASDTGNSTL